MITSDTADTLTPVSSNCGCAKQQHHKIVYKTSETLVGGREDQPPSQTSESSDKVNGGELGDQMKRGLPRTVGGSHSRLIFNYIVYVRNSYT